MNRFHNILNFRDVGSNINTLSTNHPLKERILYRSARPDEASANDRQLLISEYKVKTIIDLRSKTELINAAKKHSDSLLLAQSALVPSADSDIAAPLHISGIRYEEINLNGKGFETALLWRLSWFNIARLMTLMALGYRTEAISLLGKEVMQPRGLIGLGIDTLDFSGDEIKEVFNVLGDQEAYPVLIHCTQGKDRTGLIILLILLLCDVNLEAICKDYVKSEVELEPEKAERMKEIASIGLDESFAGCPPEFVDRLVEHTVSQDGGIKQYLARIGVDPDIQANVREFICS